MTSDDKSNGPVTPDEAIAALDALCVEMVAVMGRFKALGVRIMEMADRVSTDEQQRIITASKRFSDTIIATIKSLDAEYSRNSKP